jgi:hypothetical protein
MPKPLPSPEMLRKLLRYEPDTGKLFWRERTPDMFEDGSRPARDKCATWNGRYANKQAGTVTNFGYISVSIWKCRIMAHRIAWAMYYGDLPKFNIDHINGNGLDNKISNLRDVDQKENSRNQRARSNNAGNITGVHWDKSRNQWQAYIKVNYKQIHLGRFKSLDAAIAARKDAEVKYNFHQNHGRN